MTRSFGINYRRTQLYPAVKLDVILSGLPLTGDHPMHPFIIDPKGNLFVDLGTATNACEEKNRQPLSKGLDPCVEKETRGGNLALRRQYHGTEVFPCRALCHRHPKR